MTDQAENPALKRQIYENCVLRDSEALVVNYLRQYRHRVFVCKFCETDWNTAQEYFDHLPCEEFEDNAANKKALSSASLEAKWKELYNKFRDHYQAIVDGKAPFRAVPYCTCEVFRDRQDCQCMAEKRGEAYKEFITQHSAQMLVVYHHYIRAKHDELLEGITNEYNSRTSILNQTCQEAHSGNSSESLERRTLDRIEEMERNLEKKYQHFFAATDTMIKKDIEIIKLRGRRRFEPRTLTTQGIDVITEAILQEIKCATFLAQSWGDYTSPRVTNAALHQIQRGLEFTNTQDVLEANEIFDTARDCLDRTSVYFAIMAKFIFLNEEWNDATITKDSNRLVRQALWVDAMELAEEFENTWSSHVFRGEAALQEATTFLGTMEDQQSPELSSALAASVNASRKELEKASDLMDRMRETATNKDWDLMGSDIFDRAVQVLNNPEMPLYKVEEMLREFNIS